MNIKLTEDGGYKPYIHGKIDNSVATITFDTNVKDIKDKEYQSIENDEILLDDEIDEYLKEQETVTN